MKSLTLMSALLLCYWISVSVSHTVDVQPGEDVTLLCSNISKTATTTEWFRVVNRTRASCVSSMYGSEGKTLLCDGFDSRFEMSSNNFIVFLKINRVDLSDSGLYFAGFYIEGHTVINDTIQLNVQGDGESDYEEDADSEEELGEVTNLPVMILGVLTGILTVVIIVLAVKLHSANEQQHPERNKDLDSDDLNSAAAPRLLSKTMKNKRPSSVKEVETCVIYDAIRFRK